MSQTHGLVTLSPTPTSTTTHAARQNKNVDRCGSVPLGVTLEKYKESKGVTLVADFTE